jgi:predicted hotdog family 3-hydroxylacyl-ACP dehydratase
VIDIASLIPHGGAMVLLDAVEHWDAGTILCRSSSHLLPANPLRREGMLPALAGIEYGCQAAALHGALTGGAGLQRPGLIASLRGVGLQVARLDDPGYGVLKVAARLERAEAGGMLYEFALSAEDGRTLLDGRAAIALP